MGNRPASLPDFQQADYFPKSSNGFGIEIAPEPGEQKSSLRMVFHFAVSTAWPISIISLAYEPSPGSLLSNNRITSRFEANTAKRICNNCLILL